jgi:hypothetical protein|nr:MAG TPA: hypothetical protein [Crassvirales sp.]
MTRITVLIPRSDKGKRQIECLKDAVKLIERWGKKHMNLKVHAIIAEAYSLESFYNYISTFEVAPTIKAVTVKRINNRVVVSLFAGYSRSVIEESKAVYDELMYDFIFMEGIKKHKIFAIIN